MDAQRSRSRTHASVPPSPRAGAGTPSAPAPAPATHRVVVNDEEQYALWPAGRPAPAGWRDGGPSGSRDACLAHVARVWTDIRPRSARA